MFAGSVVSGGRAYEVAAYAALTSDEGLQVTIASYYVFL